MHKYYIKNFMRVGFVHREKDDAIVGAVYADMFFGLSDIVGSVGRIHHVYHAYLRAQKRE